MISPSVANITIAMCVALIAYAYVGYAAVIWLLAKVAPKRTVEAPAPRSVSIVLPVLNEQKIVVSRVLELRDCLRSSGLPGEVLVVSDGSSDSTAELVRQHVGERVRLIELPERHGKAAAVSIAVRHSKSEIIAFADVRQRWTKDTLSSLIRRFSDASVGAVGGELVIESSPGVLAGVGAYWLYEKWLRKLESAVHSTVGVSGSISAVRRALFCSIPAGTILDDMYWPLCVIMQGKRVVHEDAAVALDRLPDHARDEFRRKVRTLSGNFQLCARLPRVLIPFANPVWFQLVSHKLLRLIVPWAMLVLLLVTASTPGQVYRTLFLVQIAGYLLAIVPSHVWPRRLRSLSGAAGAFLLLNAAAWVAFWVWISGRSTKSWTKSNYAGRSSSEPLTAPIAASA